MRTLDNIKEAVLNNVNYYDFPVENQYHDDRTAYNAIAFDTTLLQMFGGLNTLINQFPINFFQNGVQI